MSWSGGERVVHSVVIELASTGGGAICREGTVTWRYPHHSALRVSFTLPLRSLVSNDRYHYHEDVEGHDVYYKVCCIVSVAYCDVKVGLHAWYHRTRSNVENVYSYLLFYIVGLYLQGRRIFIRQPDE